MKELIHISNGGKEAMYVGGKMIPPGETRHFEPHELPPHLRPQAPSADPETTDNPLAELLKKKVADVVAALPDLSDEDLQRLGGLEQVASKPRTSLLGAIAEETLKRAGSGQDD